MTYEFSVLADLFNVEMFTETQDIRPARHIKWSGICAAKSRLTGYHVHFDGAIQAKRVRFRVYYAEGSTRPGPDEQEPYAETLMPWLGRFFNQPSSDVNVYAWFEKPEDRWRSRFNLPFKVTMASREVVIDGISLALPENSEGAYQGSLKKHEGKLDVSVKLSRKLDFSKFKLHQEIKVFSEITKLWIEEAES